MCQRYGVATIIGALSPTEILTAWEGGATYVKVFPANLGGPRYFRDVLAPLPQVKLVPTGGVDLENAATSSRRRGRRRPGQQSRLPPRRRRRRLGQHHQQRPRHHRRGSPRPCAARGVRRKSSIASESS